MLDTEANYQQTEKTNQPKKNKTNHLFLAKKQTKIEIQQQKTQKTKYIQKIIEKFSPRALFLIVHAGQTTYLNNFHSNLN